MSVTSSANCPMDGEKRLRSYATQEVADAVFVWFGIDPEQLPHR